MITTILGVCMMVMVVIALVSVALILLRAIKKEAIGRLKFILPISVVIGFVCFMGVGMTYTPTEESLKMMAAKQEAEQKKKEEQEKKEQEQKEQEAKKKEEEQEAKEQEAKKKEQEAKEQEEQMAAGKKTEEESQTPKSQEKGQDQQESVKGEPQPDKKVTAPKESEVMKQEPIVTKPVIAEKKYPTSFTPSITVDCTNTSINANITADCPDGTILDILLVNEKVDTYAETVTIQNGKCSASFTLTDTAPMVYEGQVWLRFNVEDIKQPEAVKKVYGAKGELLTGNNLSEAVFDDDSKGKMATAKFTVNFPSKEAIKQAKIKEFNQVKQTLIDSSNGIILNIEDHENGVFVITVSNIWYFSSKDEKQNFADTLYQLFISFAIQYYDKDIIILTIYDESDQTVAKSKTFGGMEIKK